MERLKSPKSYKNTQVSIESSPEIKKSGRRLKPFLFVLALIILIGGWFFLRQRFNVSADVQPSASITGATLPPAIMVQSDFELKIDKLNIVAPILAEVDASDKDKYFASLQRGVAQMEGTADPDQKGNLVIFGHSNFYESDPGAYKQIFRNLDQLQKGDQIIIHYKNKDYQYKVVKQQIVLPTDTWVITAKYDLTLLTCWPPGTTDKRLVVFANKI